MSDLCNDLRSLGNDAAIFGQNLLQEISNLQDEVSLSERANQELLEKAVHLSGKIIEAQKKKLSLLQSRDKLLRGRAQILPTKETQRQKSAELFQAEATQEKQSMVEFDDTQSEELISPVALEEPDAASGRDDEKELPPPNHTDETSIFLVVDADTKNKISAGLERFNHSKQQSFEVLRHALPDDLKGVHLTKKLQIHNLEVSEIVCSATWHEVIVLATTKGLFVHNLKKSKSFNVHLEKTATCMDIQSEDKLFFGAESALWWVQLADLGNKGEQILYQFDSSVAQLKLHPYQPFAVVALHKGIWSLIDFHSQKILRNQLEYAKTLSNAAFVFDSEVTMSIFQLLIRSLSNLITQDFPERATDTGSPIRGMDIHPNGALLATISDKGSITFWDLRVICPIKTIEMVHEFKSVKFMHLENWICARDEHFVKLMNIYKYPQGTTSWTNMTTSPLSFIQLDRSGRIVCCAAGRHVRILKTEKNQSGNFVPGLEETVSLDMEEAVVNLNFLERGFWILLESGELQKYSF